MQSLATKKSASIEKQPANNWGCEFCGRKFARESTVYNHLCEQKRRWLDRDRPSNRIGYTGWLQFYNKHSSQRKERTYEDFIKSTYYIAFVKWGNYCVDVGVLNPPRYLDWLLHNKIKIDAWHLDSNYNRYLCEYLREEDAYDAVARSVKTTNEIASDTGIADRDVLRWGNPGKICHNISKGKISPWILYHSKSGVEFLNRLDPTQVKMIFDYINPELWAIVFKRRSSDVAEIKTLLDQGGY